MTKSVEESMQALSRAVLSEAQAEAEQILTDARAKADAIRQRAEDQAASERAKILERARQEATHIRSQAIAAAQLQAKRLQLEHREKLLDSVFHTARQRLAAIRQWTDYEQILQQLIQEAATALGADTAQIHADPQSCALLTEQTLSDLSAKLGIQLQLDTPLDHGTGVIVDTGTHGGSTGSSPSTSGSAYRQYDNTLEARLNRLQDSLRAPVYHILMGEQL